MERHASSILTLRQRKKQCRSIAIHEYSNITKDTHRQFAKLCIDKKLLMCRAQFARKYKTTNVVLHCYHLAENPDACLGCENPDAAGFSARG